MAPNATDSMSGRAERLIGWALIVVFGGLIALMLGGWALNWITGEYPSHDEEWLALTFIGMGSAVAGIPAAIGVWLVRRDRAQHRARAEGKSDVNSIDASSLAAIFVFASVGGVLLWLTELVLFAAIAVAFVAALFAATVVRLATRRGSPS